MFTKWEYMGSSDTCRLDSNIRLFSIFTWPGLLHFFSRLGAFGAGRNLHFSYPSLHAKRGEISPAVKYNYVQVVDVKREQLKKRPPSNGEVVLGGKQRVA